VKLLAALSVGTFCALLVGAFAGVLPRRIVVRRAPARSRDRMQVWLQQAGLSMTPVQFIGGSIAAGLGALLVLTALTGSPFVGIIPAVALGLLPRAFFARRRRERMRTVHGAWPDGLRDLLASIASGRSLTQAVNALAATGPPPLREAFGRFPELARVLGTAPALEIVKEELADPTSDRIIEVLILAHERGGGIVRAILDDLVDTTTNDLKLLDELETEGLEMRINARAVVVLPWVVLVALTARPGAFRDFYRTGGGVTTIFVAGVLTAIGVVVLDRLGRDHVEDRVLRTERSSA
jgi:tight adherence protein B